MIQLKIYEKPPVIVKNEQFMFQVIRASFNQRRKTLVNGLLNYPGFSLEKEKILEVLETCGIPGNIRGESLSLVQFAQLSNALNERL